MTPAVLKTNQVGHGIGINTLFTKGHMSLKNAIDKLKYDSRMVDINMKSQVLNAPDYKKHLEKLPDLKSNAMQVELDSERHGYDDGESAN